MTHTMKNNIPNKMQATSISLNTEIRFISTRLLKAKQTTTGIFYLTIKTGRKKVAY